MMRRSQGWQASHTSSGVPAGATAAIVRQQRWVAIAWVRLGFLATRVNLQSAFDNSWAIAIAMAEVAPTMMACRFSLISYKPPFTTRSQKAEDILGSLFSSKNFQLGYCLWNDSDDIRASLAG